MSREIELEKAAIKHQAGMGNMLDSLVAYWKFKAGANWERKRAKGLVEALEKIVSYKSSKYTHRSFMDDMYEIRETGMQALKKYQGASDGKG